MTHRDILLAELSQRDRISMRELLITYGPRGYTQNGFAVAARRLRKAGRLHRELYRGVYVRAGCCPCCGRAFQENR